MVKDIVVLGCSAAGLETALEIKAGAGEEADVTVISGEKFYAPRHFLKRFFRKDRGKEVTINLDFLLSEKGITFVNEEFKDLVMEEKKVITSKSDVEFDFLVIDLNMKVDSRNVSGVSDYALKFHGPDDAHKIKDHLRKKLASAKSEEDKTIVICGGGPSGVELAGELNEFLDKVCDEVGIRRIDVKLVLLEKSSALLSGFPTKAQDIVHEYLSRHGVDVRTGSEVEKVKEGSVLLERGDSLEAGTIIWCGGVTPDASFRNRELRTKENGSLVINPYMQSVSEATIYALGEGVVFRESNYPGPEKSSLSNIRREAKVVTNNIVTNVLGGDKEVFEFKKTPVWISLGRDNCMVSWGDKVFSGKFINFLNNLRESSLLKKWK